MLSIRSPCQALPREAFDLLGNPRKNEILARLGLCIAGDQGHSDHIGMEDILSPAKPGARLGNGVVPWDAHLCDSNNYTDARWSSCCLSLCWQSLGHCFYIDFWNGFWNHDWFCPCDFHRKEVLTLRTHWCHTLPWNTANNN